MYRTIVADPPWAYKRKWNNGANSAKGFKGGGALDIPYPEMKVEEIARLPVGDLVHPDGAHLYLWATNKFLHDEGLGGAFAQTAEYILFCRRDLPITSARQPSSWFNWKRTCIHSRKPEAMQDLVERVSRGPYLELFARRERLGWDTWGNESANSSGLQLTA